MVINLSGTLIHIFFMLGLMVTLETYGESQGLHPTEFENNHL